MQSDENVNASTSDQSQAPNETGQDGATENNKQESKAVETPKASHSLDAKEEDSLETEQVVVFKLEDEEYAAPILEVQEIIPTGDITAFPNVPEYIAGIINVRGTVATVINLASRFGLHRQGDANLKDRYIILTRSHDALFGIMVDEVTSVMKIPKNKITSAQGFNQSKISTDYVQGVAVVDERIIILLDFQRILDEEAIQAASQNSKSI